MAGGLTRYQAMAILRAIKGLDFKGVEVSPRYDHAEMTANAVREGLGQRGASGQDGLTGGGVNLT